LHESRHFPENASGISLLLITADEILQSGVAKKLDHLPINIIETSDIPSALETREAYPFQVQIIVIDEQSIQKHPDQWETLRKKTTIKHIVVLSLKDDLSVFDKLEFFSEQT
jgi:hypothetical protein